MELGHFDKHTPTTTRKNGSAGKRSLFFCLETLKNRILNEKFYPQMTTIRAFCPQIRAPFSNFRKRAGKTSPSTPSSYAPVTTTFSEEALKVSQRNSFQEV